MLKVVETFFLTKEEVEKLGSKYVNPDYPHYKLEDGTIFYGKAMATGSCWTPYWSELGITLSKLSSVGDLVRWETLGGKKYCGILKEWDSNVAIVDIDGKEKAVEC